MIKPRLLLLCLLWPLASLAQAGDSAPDFSLPTKDKHSITLSEMQGKVVYLDFWASWCGPCRQSFPWLNSLYQRYRSEGLEIIAVNLDRRTQAVEKFLRDTPALFPIALDPDGRVADLYTVEFMPSSYLIDRNGKLIGSHFGFRESDKDKWEAKIRAALVAVN